MDGMENDDDEVMDGQMKWKNEMDGIENDDDEVTDGQTKWKNNIFKKCF